MKDSGIAWIGEIPEEWATKPISCMSVSRSGGTPDRGNMNYWDNATIPWMSSGEVNKINVYETDEKIRVFTVSWGDVARATGGGVCQKHKSPNFSR